MPIMGGGYETALQMIVRYTDSGDNPPYTQTFYCADEDCPCEGSERIVFQVIYDDEFSPASITEAATEHVRAQLDKEARSRT
jgi:hypothetical protein